MTALSTSRRRGAPLILLAMVLVSWVGVRAAVWDNPFTIDDIDLSLPESLLAEASATREEGVALVRDTAEQAVSSANLAAWGQGYDFPVAAPARLQSTYYLAGERPGIAAGHSMLMAAAFEVDWDTDGVDRAFGMGPSRSQSSTARVSQAAPPFAQTPPPLTNSTDRWSLDAFAFYRNGSGNLSTAQGRVPVYGASQLAANLQYRFAPNSGHDPRAYARAYHALVANGETEVAAGVSARPIGAIPIRFYAEVRATQNPVGTELRPAAYAVTEFAPQDLLLGFALETYSAAGYVEGDAATYFVDGQAAVTREAFRQPGLADRPIRFSVGGGIWGGAQEDAARLDVGPTLRVDMNVGEVPARVSVDWRERVAGDAAPNSGVAATLSTQF